MGQEMIEDVLVSDLKIIDVPGGDVLHAMKREEQGYSGFGEVYFSTVEPTVIKAWKRHREMIMNLVVPIGEIRFVIVDDRDKARSSQTYFEITLSRKNYNVLLYPRCLGRFSRHGNSTSMLLNIASIPHDPNESDQKALEEIQFDWSINK